MWKTVDQFIKTFEKTKHLNLLNGDVLCRLMNPFKEENIYQSEKIDYVIESLGGIDVLTTESKTLLGIACRLMNEENVALLLKKGADPNRRAHFQMTPFMTAIRNRNCTNKTKKKIIISLLEAGASLRIPSDMDYHDLYHFAKAHETEKWLQLIEEQKEILNPEQKKEWNQIRFQYIFK